jgi:hypothetical protein
MPVESKHPSYSAHILDWQVCRDVYDGESAVKARDNGRRYLPATMGQIMDGADAGANTNGAKAYCAYRDRATLDGFYEDAIDLFLGMLWHRGPQKIELGPLLEPLYGDNKPVTQDGENLLELLRAIQVQLLVTGRCGLMGDMPEGISVEAPKPYIELYVTERVINWDDGDRSTTPRQLRLVVLDESGPVLGTSLEWEATKNKYRVLKLGNPTVPNSAGKYFFAKDLEAGGFDPSKLEDASVRGKALEELPFVFVNTKTTTPAIQGPPYLSLARRVLALYRMDADYRQQLHMQGQDTLLTIGATDDEVKAVGAGAWINIANPDGDGKFIGLSGKGLDETRQAIENDRALAAKKAGELLADSSKQRESGEALELRTGRKGVSLSDIADQAAEGLTKILRILARWLGASEAESQEIIIEPNREFGTPMLDPSKLESLMKSVLLNAPVTLEEVRGWVLKHGIAKDGWEDFLKKKKAELEEHPELQPMPAPSPGDEEDDDEDEAAE